MSENKSKIMWAIIGNFGLYADTGLTRTEMISKHTSALGKTWRQCRKDGDKAIHVRVSPIAEKEAK